MDRWPGQAGLAAGLLAVGLIGGAIGAWVGLPMPFLLGSLIAVALVVTGAAHRLPDGAQFPKWLREMFIVIVAVMIGGSVTADQIPAFGTLGLSVLAVAAFAVSCTAVNYLIFTRFGGVGPVTAICAGMPAGLVSGVVLAEQYGGDVRIVAVQQFVRVILVILTIPVLFQLATGQAVGSAAGASLAGSAPAADGWDWAWHMFAGAAGAIGGYLLRIPAGYFVGPIVLTGALHLGGVTTANLPDWLMTVAQWIIGTSIGARFLGFSGSMLVRSLALGAVSVLVMGAIACLIAALMLGPLQQGFPVMFLAFAPGGVIEMGLIALSLAYNPVVVTFHHLLRIIITMGVAAFVLKLITKKNPT